MINLRQIPTSGNHALCGYYSMANYIMTLPFNLRKKFYIKLFSELTNKDYSSVDDGMFLLLEELLEKKEFSEINFNTLKIKFQQTSHLLNFKEFKRLFLIHHKLERIDFQHLIGQLLSNFGKKIVKSSRDQLLGNGTHHIDQSAIIAIRESAAESFITAENLKKTFKFFFPNQDMAMSQEIEYTDLQPQATGFKRQTITTESPTHSNPRLQSIANIVHEKCQELVPRKSDSLKDFLEKSPEQKDEILFYLLLMSILNRLKIKDQIQIFNCPLTYDRYSKYFKFNEELIIDALRELINFDNDNEKQEQEKITQILGILDGDLNFTSKARLFLTNILENLKKQFSLHSFRFKFLSSNPFCVLNDCSVHYTTMIDSNRIYDPCTNVSFQYDLSSPTQSNEQNQISQMMIEDLFEKSKRGYRKYMQNVTDQSASDSELIKIYRSTEIFPRYNGRDNDIIRCEKRVNEVEKDIQEILIKLKEKHRMMDEDLVLAMAIAKTFGGIGSAYHQIREIVAKKTTPQQPLGQQSDKFFELCNSLILDTAKLKNFCQFSADFQKECQQAGIYSGRLELTDQQAKRYGCRLAFVPDEVFAFHFNALRYRSRVRQYIDQYIAQHQKPKIIEKKLTTTRQDRLASRSRGAEAGR